MEWGIVRGNDVELYGEKGKAYLMRGAKPLPGITDYPDVAAGYGRLCVEQSIPKWWKYILGEEKMLITF